MNRRLPTSLMLTARRTPLWLATSEGVCLPAVPERLPEPVGSIDGPETPLEVEFFGITEEQQRAALRAFPGGRRFRLANSRH